MGCAILSTVQKFNPFVAVVKIFSSNLHFNVFLFFCVAGAFISSLLGINQSYLRNLMAYSSITHSSWIGIRALFRVKILLLYLSFYLVFTFYLFGYFNTNNLNSLDMIRSVNRGNMLIVFLLIVVLSGIPPFIIFFLKVMIVRVFINFNLLCVAFLFLRAGISIFYYMYLIVPCLMNLNNYSGGVFSFVLLNFFSVVFIFLFVGS